MTIIPILCTRNILAIYKIIYNILCVMNNNVSPILQVFKSEYPAVFREKMGNKELVKRKTGFKIYFPRNPYFAQDVSKMLQKVLTMQYFQFSKRKLHTKTCS